MRKSWVKKVTMFQNRNKRIADFTHFVQFVTRESETANSLYDRRVLGSQFEKDPTTSFKSKKTLESSYTCTTTTIQSSKQFQNDQQANAIFAIAIIICCFNVQSLTKHLWKKDPNL